MESFPADNIPTETPVWRNFLYLNSVVKTTITAILRKSLKHAR